MIIQLAGLENGYYPDELDTMDIFKGYKGELEINAIPVKKDEVFQYDVPADLVAGCRLAR